MNPDDRVGRRLSPPSHAHTLKSPLTLTRYGGKEGDNLSPVGQQLGPRRNRSAAHADATERVQPGISGEDPRPSRAPPGLGAEQRDPGAAGSQDAPATSGPETNLREERGLAPRGPGQARVRRGLD